MILSEMLLSWRLAPDARPEHVSEIFKRARVWCKQHAVTGVLVYDGECLMGNFEAPQVVLRRIHDAYKADRRHVGVRVQHLQDIERRNYGVFRAGYVLEECVQTESDSSLTPLMGLAGDRAKMAFRQLRPELE